MSRRDRVIPKNGWWSPFEEPAARSRIQAYLRGECDEEPDGFMLLVLQYEWVDADNPPGYRLTGMQQALDRRFPLACATCRESFVPNHPTYIRCSGCRNARRDALAAAGKKVAS